MYCEKCGRKLEDSAKFCTKCGALVEEKESEHYNDSSQISFKTNNIKILGILMTVILIFCVTISLFMGEKNKKDKSISGNPITANNNENYKGEEKIRGKQEKYLCVLEESWCESEKYPTSQTFYTYDEQGNLLRKGGEAGADTGYYEEYTYDSYNNLTSIRCYTDGELEFYEEYEYDSRNRRVKEYGYTIDKILYQIVTNTYSDKDELLESNIVDVDENGMPGEESWKHCYFYKNNEVVREEEYVYGELSSSVTYTHSEYNKVKGRREYTNDSSIEIIERTYNDDGTLAEEKTMGSMGEVDNFEKYSYENGKLVRMDECKNDGSILYSSIYKYDDKGNLIEEWRQDAGGEIHKLYSYEYELLK